MKPELQNTIDKLRKELRNPLPGVVVHQRMLPPDRIPEPHPENTTVAQSSVLLLLFPEDDNIKIVFIRRPSFMKNHAGQIAFPGGRFEPGDKNLAQTALREAVEEIGIDQKEIEILGELSPLYVVVSNFSIHAFVGWSRSVPDFQINYNEVGDLFTISVDALINSGTLKSQEVNTSLGMSEFPGYLVDEIFIWGATAMILTEFIEIYNKII